MDCTVMGLQRVGHNGVTFTFHFPLKEVFFNHLSSQTSLDPCDDFASKAGIIIIFFNFILFLNFT